MQETHREYHRLERQTLSAFIPGVGKLVDSAMLKEDRKHIDEVFERMMRNGPFSSVELLDSDRKVVHIRDFSRGSAPGKSDSLSKVPEHHAEVEFPVLNRPACVRCHGSSKTTLGAVRIVAPLERSREMLGRHLRWRLVFGAVALILAGFFAAGFLRAMVQAPMRRMLRAMDRVRGGDLEARLDPELPGELSLMARRFNAMARRLREDREEIDQMYRRQVSHMDRLASLGELAANFAHEVRNPLTGIGSAIQVLQQGMPPQDDRRGVLAKVLGQVDRINKTLENFLHFSRIPEARMRLFDLSEPLLRVRFLLESRARSQGVSLVCEAGSGLPTVFGDPGQVEQVLLNLGLNALQAMGGKGTLDI
ncbi:MAG: histidine kinase dimerization/phospho-acceptor domain-containing protein, partial [Elusimicrobiota bacterium]